MNVSVILFVVTLFCVDVSASEIIPNLEFLEENNIQDSINFENQNEEGRVVIINIFSSSIGKRIIKLVEGKWPVSIKFHLYTGFVDEVSVSLMPDGENILNIPKISFRKDGSPSDMKKYEWYKSHEYYEVVLSKNQLSNKADRIKISWITYM